jgi:heme/copper-type cytochrome/quinol oxidase subunit 2
MKKILSTVLVIGALLAFVSPFAMVPVSAQTILPPVLKDIPTYPVKDLPNNASKIVTSVLTIMFIVVFVVAVFYTFMAAIKYIRSEGNEQKVEEAKNAIKAVLFGVAAIFIAIVGILLINAFFNGGAAGTDAFSTAIKNIIDPLRGQ